MHKLVAVGISVLLGIAINKYLIRPLVPASVSTSKKLFG